MKKIGKLKLNELNKAEMEKREMNLLKGGDCCNCGCGGSLSVNDNFTANEASGYTISDGWYGVCACIGSDDVYTIAVDNYNAHSSC